MRTTIIVALLAVLSTAVSVEAQYVRIGDAGVLPSGGLRPPTVLKSTLALYTDDARTRGIEGIVTIEAVIGEDGQTKSMRVFKGFGSGLDEVERASVQQGVVSAGAA